MEGKETTIYTIKVNLPGGIVSVGDFYEILKAAEKAGIDTVRFGNRQQLYLQVSPKSWKIWSIISLFQTLNMR
ncbi:hypothetical protein ADIARSV_0849 [Arcticibacter svalbardensis MN12-7]|uniref:Nitrite/Sulfite reductase ferredoxin-like domain-containing protein n=1 Tax=Arcticibacter svalbardensis MN12-7 TaxID=1150600 RepID=R9H444_9SPHI|nr:hypothetical protein [Arcticibacter svalbardensis]EOR95959.1 hypothetical protein ADIARSV_0849 [Arcticibacter svalbardensis MN12-7]